MNSVILYPLYYRNYAGFWVKVLDVNIDKVESLKEAKELGELPDYWSINPPSNPIIDFKPTKLVRPTYN
jgi:hypothetical protein